MTPEEFCKEHTGYFGEEVTSLKQIVFHKFTGEELKEYVDHHINQYISKLKERLPEEGYIMKELNCHIVNCNNSTSIFNTKDWIEYKDALEELYKFLSQVKELLTIKE